MPRRRYLLVLIALLGSIFLQACGADPATPTPTPTPVQKEGKIDTVLLGIFLKYTTTEGSKDQKLQVAVDYARQQNIIDDKDQVTFELELDDPTAEKPITDKINTMGGQVTNSTTEGNLVKLRVRVPVKVFVDYANSANQDNYLTDLAGFKGVTGINIIYPRQKLGLENLPQTREALFQLGRNVKNEGVKIMQTDKWQAAGYSGKGVKIGIIDGGFKYFQDLRGTYLPPDYDPVDIDKQAGGSGVLEEDVHGSAVTEIIYSHAPDAQYFAAAIDGSDDEFSKALDYLAGQGVSIISCSMGGHGTAGDGSSFLEQKMNRLRKEKGILFIISAGNEGASHYAGYFDPDANGYHQFLPGVNRMAIGNPSSAGYNGYLLLNWEQWKDGGINPQATDLDLFVTDAKDNVLRSSTGDQRARTPKEIIPLQLAANQLVYIKVRLKNPAAKVDRFRLHIFTHDLPVQFIVPSMSIGDPASAAGALAVGATNVDKDVIEYYSSQGPLTNGVFKPEISAPARVSSGAYQEDGEVNFPGTSASCPQVSGMAAVLKSANPSLTVDQLTTVVLEHVKDLGVAGPDITFGYGRANAGSNPGPNDAKPQGKLAPSPLPNNNPNLQPTVLVTLKPGFSYPTPIVSGTRAATTTVAGATTSPPLTADAPPETAVPISGISFSDTFKDTSSGLPNSGQTAYKQGLYSVKANPNQLAWGVYPVEQLALSEFSAEVSVNGISGDTGLYGLVFWHKSATNYFLLSVTGGGQVQIGQFNSGKWTEILPWTRTTNWKAGSANKVAIVASADGLKITVNGRAVNNQPAKGAGSGAIGFAAGSYGGAVEANFTDFRLAARD